MAAVYPLFDYEDAVLALELFAPKLRPKTVSTLRKRFAEAVEKDPGSVARIRERSLYGASKIVSLVRQALGEKTADHLDTVVGPNPHACWTIPYTNGKIGAAPRINLSGQIGEGTVAKVYEASVEGISTPIAVKIVKNLERPQCRVANADDVFKIWIKYLGQHITKRGAPTEAIRRSLNASTAFGCGSFVDEAVTSALVSELWWKGHSPHFLRFYGGILCRYPDKTELFDGYLIMEKADLPLESGRGKGLMRNVRVAQSVVMQVLGAIVSLQKNYRGVHHDLHIGNIMLSVVERGRLVYQGNDFADSPILVYDLPGGRAQVPHEGYLVRLCDVALTSLLLPNGTRSGLELPGYSGVDECKRGLVGEKKGVLCGDFGEFSHRFRGWYDIQTFLLAFDHLAQHNGRTCAHCLAKATCGNPGSSPTVCEAHAPEAWKGQFTTDDFVKMLFSVAGRAETDVVTNWDALDDNTRNVVTKHVGDATNLPLKFGMAHSPLRFEGVRDEDTTYAPRVMKEVAKFLGMFVSDSDDE